MLWLYLLAAVTGLVIILRRVVQRQKPLNDELYSSKVAVEHVHSGVGWVRADGNVGTLNQSLTDSIGSARAGELLERDWHRMFALHERSKVNKAYTQMLLAGIATIETLLERGDGTLRAVNLRLVAVHDHKLRLVGFHCMVQDKPREQSLAHQVRVLSESLLREKPSAPTVVERSEVPTKTNRQRRRAKAKQLESTR
jgi:hypothetical protein